MHDQLESIRKQIDDADRRLIEALADRQQVVDRIASVKLEHNGEIRDPDREKQLLSRLLEQARQAGLNDQLVEAIYQQILDQSVRHQAEVLLENESGSVQDDPVVVAYQGGDGAYSHLACKRHFSSANGVLRCRGHNTFQEAADAVRNGNAHYALLPIENTTAGSINETYDLLAKMDLCIIGEEVLHIDHCLVTLDPIPLAHLRRVFSHPQAIAQCTAFLSSLAECQVSAYDDTALAVRKIKEEGDPSQAAIASRQAAEHYGLHILRKGIANQQENYTRFVVVASEGVEYDERIPCKTSVLFATPHKKGALIRCLNVLNDHGINMVKLESRPRENTPWEYRFYLDLEGNVVQEHVSQALQELTREVTYLKVLGSYPERNISWKRMGTESAQAPKAQAARPSSSGDGVQQEPVLVVPEASNKPYELAARKATDTATQVQVGRVTIGGDKPVLIAGPCSVEAREQIQACAEAVRLGGGHILRGGCFKPRTSPYSFQGMGYEGLDIMKEAGRKHNLPIVTEVMRPEDVAEVARQADMLQIGARSMQNFALLKEVGRVNRPVMLKRGMMASIDEFLAAAEYILSQGNQQVVLCERGIRTFETATRNTLDLSAVPVLRERTHLPVIVDPAHACGNWRWIRPLTRAALAVGADGVMVEIHPKPAEALSDGPQSLKFERFRRLAAEFHQYA